MAPGYDEEARYFEDGVRRAKAGELSQRAQALIRGAHDGQMGHLRAAVLARLAASLDGRQAGAETFAACAARCVQALRLHPCAPFSSLPVHLPKAPRCSHVRPCAVAADLLGLLSG